MIRTGLSRRVDDLGRIMIPKVIRGKLNIRDGDALECFIEKECIVLKKCDRETEVSGKVKHGEWQNDSGYDDWYCSECGLEINYDGEYPSEFENFRYCGRCGANMERK